MSGTDLSQQKNRLRNKMKKIRDAIPEEERKRKSKQICKMIIQHVLLPMERNGEELCLLSYMPIRSEVDTTPLLEWAWSNGHRLLLPKVNKNTPYLQLHVVNSMDDLEIGIWGIREPNERSELWTSNVDVMIVPGLAFDRQGGRLGYGGGYYDRLWANWNHKEQQPLKVAAAYDEQLISHVPTEGHDMPIDIFVTETMVYEVSTGVRLSSEKNSHDS